MRQEGRASFGAMVPTCSTLPRGSQMRNENELFDAVKMAFHILLHQHSVLLDVNANERSITHKLAEALQEVLRDPNVHVDCEYNRHEKSIKTIHACYRNMQVKPYDLDARTVYPDIVVHERGNDTANVLVIEVKKQTNSPRHSDFDREKLKAFTSDQFHYQVGLYVEIDTTAKRIGKVECYRKGTQVVETIWTTLSGLTYM
jgi:hypothetical protein